MSRSSPILYAVKAVFGCRSAYAKKSCCQFRFAHCLQFFLQTLLSALTLSAFQQPPLSWFWLKKPKPRQRLLLALRHLLSAPAGASKRALAEKANTTPA